MIDKARLIALMLGPAFELLVAEERRKGTSEAKIKQVVDLVVAAIEREQRGKTDDATIGQIILTLKEVAFSTHGAPEGKQ
jgi:hypothetical protein